MANNEKQKIYRRNYYKNYFRNNTEQREKNRVRRKINYWKKKLNKLSEIAQICVIPYPVTLEELQLACKNLKEYDLVKEKRGY